MTAEIDDTLSIAEDDGLLFGCILDGSGSAALVGWSQVENWTAEDGPLWVHLDRSSPRVRLWLSESSDLTVPTIDALLADETRPRVFRGNKGVIAILRGVNNNDGAEPEDMVAIRMWSDGKRLITLRHRKLMTPRDLIQQLVEFESGPSNISQLYERLIARLIERMAGTVTSYEDRLGELESNLDLSRASKLRRELSQLRQDTVTIRRYMNPQREALNTLLLDPPSWMEDHDRMHLRETADRLTRYVEELDSTRERTLVLKDDIANQLAESTGKTLYLLAIISAIFLPLGFLTGLLGINIGGMPGVDSPHAFWVFCGSMVVLLAVEIFIFRKLKWF